MQATRTAADVLPAMVYERLPVADAAAAQLGCMLLDDRALLTLEILEGTTAILLSKRVRLTVVVLCSLCIWAQSMFASFQCKQTSCVPRH